MKATLIYRNSRPWAAHENWTCQTKVIDFLNQNNGKMFHNKGVGNPIIIYADIHPSAATVSSWFPDGSLSYGSISVTSLDAPDNLNTDTIFNWLESVL